MNTENKVLVLGIALTALKVIGVVDWSWWIVLAPIYLIFGGLFALFLWVVAEDFYGEIPPSRFASIADWLITRAKLTPYTHISDYMQRFWLVPYRESQEEGDGCGPVNGLKRPVAWLMQQLGIACRVHCILRSDHDRACHDHPAPFLTIILRGSYIEVTPKYDRSRLYRGVERRRYGVGSARIRRASAWHRLELLEGSVWTLFFTWGRDIDDREWGFLKNPDFKVTAKDYTSDSTGGEK